MTPKKEDKKMKSDTKRSMSDAAKPAAAVKKEGLEAPHNPELENQIAALEKQLDESKAQMLRLQAELENVRRRSEQAVSDAHKFASSKLLQDCLPVMDSLHRALEGEVGDDPQLQNMRKGIELTADMFSKTLEKHGVEPIVPEVGEVFDPERHQAMSMAQDDKAEPNTILQVLEKGYVLNGRVVRAAMVIVAGS